MADEVRVLSLDARVEYPPHNVLAERGERHPRGVGLHRADRFVEHRADRKIGPDAVDRALLERRPGTIAGADFVQPDQLADRLALQPGEQGLQAQVALLGVRPLALRSRAG